MKIGNQSIIGITEAQAYWCSSAVTQREIPYKADLEVVWKPILPESTDIFLLQLQAKADVELVFPVFCGQAVLLGGGIPPPK